MPRLSSTSRYVVAPYDPIAARRLSEALGLAGPVAAILVRRGHDTPERARAFIEARERHHPGGFDAIDAVVDRVLTAARAGKRITVHGDYDVDGVCATAILVEALRALGASCDWYLPAREEDGYGLSRTGIERLAARGTELLVTVDCGIGCVEEVALARGLGMEVVVTDHHQPGPELPDCPILHPALSGYPCRDLCAAGVAFKLASALEEAAGSTGADWKAESALDLVALATVADVVPLRGENRALVRAGLRIARRGDRPGLRALMEVAGVSPEQLDEGDLAFRLGPRINAAGRLGRADGGVELLLSDDPARARAIAAELEQANRERRRVERDALAGAESALRELPGKPGEAPALVVAGEGWHPGVVGIVASRLAEAHNRPAVVIGLGSDGRGRGSARSIRGYDLLAGLRASERHLLRYGGHRAAAGLEIEAANVEALRTALCEHAAASIHPDDLVPTERVDAVVGSESLGLDVAQQLERLAPFGMGNPGVRLLVPASRLRDVRPMGDGSHCRFSLECPGGRALGVAFGFNGQVSAAGEGPHDLTVSLEVNRWNGSVEPRVVLRGIYPSRSGSTPALQSP